MSSSIEVFSGSNRWLSNFWTEPCGISNEHRFQARKAVRAEDRKPFPAQISAADAKALGRRLVLRRDWDSIGASGVAVKVEEMYDCLKIKFEDAGLRGRLLDTGACNLVEGNTWGDRFFGVYRGGGENWLGRCLMRLRGELAVSTGRVPPLPPGVDVKW